MSTVDQVFRQKGLWKWWEQNGGRGTNPFNGVTEKGIDYSNAFGTAIGVPVPITIVRIVHNNNSIGDVVEGRDASGGVWLFQHINTAVAVGSKLGVGGIIGFENGLPIDQFSTGPHIEVRFAPSGWNPNVISWLEPWINPFGFFSNLSALLAGSQVSSIVPPGSNPLVAGPGGVPAALANAVAAPIVALSPGAGVGETFGAIDLLTFLLNPFDLNAQPAWADQGLLDAENTFVVGALIHVAANFASDTVALLLRAAMLLIGVIILYKVVSHFIDIGAVVQGAAKAVGAVATGAALL